MGTAGVPDVAGILKTIDKAPRCISICAKASTKHVERECSTQHCKTDFCVACCGVGESQCIGNDFNTVCAPKPDVPSETPCQCGKDSGNPDSCCSHCTNEHSCPGHGKNTGPYCGNDFHAAACHGDTPICCTNDLDAPVCCKKGQACLSPLVGKNSCIDEVNMTI